MENLLIISNDKVFFSKKKVSTKHNDTINILEAAQAKFNIFLLSRSSKNNDNFSLKKKRIFKLDLQKFSFLRKKKFKVLMISITLRNVFFYLLLCLLIKDLKGFVYLRSDGYKEYEVRLGKLGILLFAIMMQSIKGKFKIISVNKNIKSPKTDYIVYPSELDKSWLKKKKITKINFPKLLYFGRFKKDKGVFSLIEIFKELKYEFRLTIAGDKNHPSSSLKNIKFLKEFSNKKKIINLYDNHDIFILPSYTEGSPKVILESLARKKPIIIFKEIKHVKKNFKGIFISKRDPHHLKKTIIHIINNYSKIQNDIERNTLITKKIFQKKLVNILND